MTETQFELPDVLDVAPDTIAAAEAALDPDIVVPEDAREDTDRRSGDKYYRWSETLVIEKAQRSKSPKSGLTVFFVQAKIRPNGTENHKNAGKRVYSRYRMNFKVQAGMETNEGHEIMNSLSLKSLTSLFKATNLLPTDAKKVGLKATFLIAMFPAETEVDVSPLIGQIVTGTVYNSPNKMENARNPRNTEVESWLPATS